MSVVDGCTVSVGQADLETRADAAASVVPARRGRCLVSSSPLSVVPARLVVVSAAAGDSERERPRARRRARCACAVMRTPPWWLVPDDTRRSGPDRFALESRRGRARDRARPLALDRIPRGVEGGRRLRLLRDGGRRRAHRPARSAPRTQRASGRRSTGTSKRGKGRVHVLVTVFWHMRSAAEMRRALLGANLGAERAARRRSRAARASSPILPARRRLPGGIEACRTARAAEVVYWIPQHRALVPGDVLIADGKGGVRMCPESWLPGEDRHATSRRRSDRSLELAGAAHPRLARRARARERPRARSPLRLSGA